jgi:RNA polymerase sigma-70 factor (ECF subfamily)
VTPDPSTPDGELVARSRRGDQDAFRRIVERYQDRAFWLARQMVGSEDAARDVAQEAFIRVFRNLDRFDVARNFYTWLYQIVTNLSIDHLRRHSRQRPTDFEEAGGLPDDRAAPDGATAQGELRRRVERLLARLPEKYKSVLVLRDLQGFSCQEVAEILGCNNATARWRLHHARKLFKAMWLGQKVDEESELP